MGNFEFISNAENANEILETNPSSYTAAILFDGISWGDEKLPKNTSYTIRYPIITARYGTWFYLSMILSFQLSMQMNNSDNSDHS